MKEEWLERICQRLQGRALLEEEVKWALRSWENELKKLEDKEMDDLLGLLVVSGKVQCTASLEAISKEGEEPFFSFFAWMKRMLRFGKRKCEAGVPLQSMWRRRKRYSSCLLSPLPGRVCIL